MADRGFLAPVEATDDGWRLNIDEDARLLIARLLDELRTLLVSGDADSTQPLLHRLFPPAFQDDEEKEAEYQRLMRDELVASRLAAINTVTEQLERDDADLLDENDVMAFMQSVNAIRLVLGTMLDITDDAAADDADEEDSPEHHLYAYLGWILEWTVRSLSAS